MFENIRVVLVETTHPGNIGSAARAMKTMGLSHLYLVSPKHFPHGDAMAMASGADDILASARITATFEEAIAGCEWVCGTSARLRHLPIELGDPHQCASRIITQEARHQIAVVFGREHSGLTNAELLQCHYHVHIPSDPEFSSLNLAAAVQIICYEIRTCWLASQHLAIENQAFDSLATADEVEGYLGHLQQTLVQMGFFNPNHVRSVMRKLRRLFQRARLENTEVKILRGILTAMQRRLGVR